jgi:hypothetical protein
MKVNRVKMSVAKFVFAWVTMMLSVFVYAAEPVAMITDLKGVAHLSGQKNMLSVLTYLPAGEEIVLEEGSLVVTYFDQSSEFTFKGPARITIQEKIAKVIVGAPAKMRELDKEKAAGAGKFARTGKLAFAAVEMRSLAIKPTLLAPVNTKLSTTRPLFSWKSLNEAEGYLLVLSDEEGKAIQQVDVTNNSWQLPITTELKLGVDYQWRVVETLKSGEKLTAKGNFSIADEATIARVFAKHPSADAGISEKVTFAIYLESEGFRDDAKTLWRELATLRPEDQNLRFRAR